MSRETWLLWALVAVQLLCAGVFILNFSASFLGFERMLGSERGRETLEIVASLGLVIGALLGIRAALRATRQQARAQQALASASGAFAEVVNEKFDGWTLTRAERDVAWFAIKGFSTREIANLRSASEGTVKAQCAAIYRKAEVSGRAQLISLLVEDLLFD